jgi:hypothetical protein
VNIDALDPNDLVWTTAKMPQDFDLLGVCPHQPRGRGCRRDYAAIRTMAAPKASQHRHGRRMATGHLHGQCRLNLVVVPSAFARRSHQSFFIPSGG